jgi:hypothetical protein
MAEDDENHSGKKNEGLLLMDPCRPAKVERKLKKKKKRNADPRPQQTPLSIFYFLYLKMERESSSSSLFVGNLR